MHRSHNKGDTKSSEDLKRRSKDGTTAPKLHQSKAIGHGKHKQLDLATTLVKMWEQFRKHECANRAEILQNILTIIKGRVKEVSNTLVKIYFTIKLSVYGVTFYG